MPRERRRVYGPYPHRRKFRVVVVTEGGQKVAQLYATQAEAAEVIAAIEAEVGPPGAPRTLREAVEKYEVRRREIGRRPTTLATTTFRLNAILGPALDLAPARLTADRCIALYAAIAKRDAVDTHRNALSEVKTFGGWLVRQRWARSNPWASVQPEGKRRHGKPQLRIDEARRWMDRAISAAGEGQNGAIAALLALTLGLRASEIVGLEVRDLDDNGRVLVIERGKTAAAARQLEVPPVLRPLLTAAARDKLPAARLLGEHWRKWPWYWVRRICDEAKVPKVSAQSMRGLYATLGMSASSTPSLVAESLGHTSPKVTMRSYADRKAVEGARRGAAVKVLEGGKARSRGGGPGNG